MKELEHLQTQILKTLTNCPSSTSPAILRLFCGVEPLACRLEILKLRYFWRILNGPTDAITYRILKYRKDNLLGSNKGFAHEVFNICCKYNILQLWHGNAPDKVNPLHFIKRTIISKNLRTDLETGRTKACCFASIFLAILLHIKKITTWKNRFDNRKALHQPMVGNGSLRHYFILAHTSKRALIATNNKKTCSTTS